MSGYEYLSGFGSEHISEALPGALPVGQNSPQIAPYGTYAEQLSGTAFTVPRARNQRSWLYRIRPSVMHEKFVPYTGALGLLSKFDEEAVDPNQMRWLPPALLPLPSSSAASPSVDFVNGLTTVAGSGSPTSKNGLAIHLYNCNASMERRCFSNSDGDFLLVPQEGPLHIQTEFGHLLVKPREIVVLPRGIKFRVSVQGPSRGYILELFTGHFQLPELGPLGANGLANARDFLYPVASFEDAEGDYDYINKFGGKVFVARMHHSPFDVIAWHGNYAPYKYDLQKFNTIGTVSFDHPDPSIFTVLTAPSDTPGVAVCDFVIFPPRWMAAERTFRPPYYHRNCMSEYMGMIWGVYDAKVGFQPGGASLHSCMTPHGPDGPTFQRASAAELKPEWFGAGLAFMFETNLMLHVTKAALEAPYRDLEYQKCWKSLPKIFDPSKRLVDEKDFKEAAASSSSSSNSAASSNSSSSSSSSYSSSADTPAASKKRALDDSSSSSSSTSSSSASAHVSVSARGLVRDDGSSSALPTAAAAAATATTAKPHHTAASGGEATAGMKRGRE